MTQGIFIHGSRPKSKKQIKEVVEAAQMSYEAQTQMLDGEIQDAQIMGGPMPSTHLHDLHCVVVEATSTFGDEFDGSLGEAERRMNLHREQGKALLEGKPLALDQHRYKLALDPRQAKFTFVGPDPYNSRKFYGTIEYNITKGRWIVK